MLNWFVRQYVVDCESLVTSVVPICLSAHSGKLNRVVVILIFKVTWSRIP